MYLYTEDEDLTNYEIGEEYIDRFAQALGSDVVLPEVFSAVAELTKGDWNHRFTAMMCISQVPISLDS